MSGGDGADTPFNFRLAGLLGAGNALRMRRLPDPAPSDSDAPVLG